MRTSVNAGLRAFAAGALSLLAAALPAQGQPPCTTEIHLYVEKSATASTRETARDFLARLNSSREWGLPGPATVTIYSFAGDVSAVNMTRRDLPPGASLQPEDVEAVLHEVAVRSPSEATTDLLKLFEHVDTTARAAAAPPPVPLRRLFFLLGDFAHSPLSERWSAEGSRLVAELRQIVVANRNVSVVAIQTPPAGLIASAIHRDVASEMGGNFLLFDDWSSSQREVSGLISDLTTPLGVNLAILPGAANPVLQIANHTCSDLAALTYSVRGDNIAPHVLGAVGPPGLVSGGALGPMPVDLAVLRPLAANPAGGCVNLWIEAEGVEARVPASGVPIRRRGMAPQPITLGSCAEITESVFDLRSKVRRSEAFAPYEHLPLRPPGNFVTGLRLRGHFEAPQATLTLRELDQRGAAGEVLARQNVAAQELNSRQWNGAPGPSLAFDGALRHRLLSVELDKRVRRRLCLGGREDEPKRLRVTLSQGGRDLASAVLIRRYPRQGDLVPHHLWESGILPLLGLLVAALFLAGRLRPAHVGRLSHVLLVLAAGFLVLGVATHFASTLGILLEESFAERLEVLSIAGVVIVAVVYGFLVFLGFFDRRPSARESLREVQRRRYRVRRSGRFWATATAVGVLLVLTLLATGVIWFLQRDVEECHFSYTAVDQP